jgi:murein DD-endopeptidase MepM/ murein hydrolase activator NlpD
MKYIVIVLFVLLVFAVIFLLAHTTSGTKSILLQPTLTSRQKPVSLQDFSLSPTEVPKEIQSPLDNPDKRITKKKFGTYVSPQNSPVQPERFTGFHTAVDFEVFPDEINKDMKVKAACSGEMELSEYAQGYGGVVVESCTINNAPVTVVYGHLKLSSVRFPVGHGINIGEVIGVLGADRSTETDGERKHLHFGIHKGSEVNIRGYVNLKDQLSGWIDPLAFF